MVKNVDESKGKNLAKVLWYYNLIQDTNSLNQKIVCPFHNDVNPSMIINLVDGSFFCFGCDLVGDAIRFVKLMEEKLNGSNDLQAYQKYLKILKSEKCSNLSYDINSKKSKPMQRDLYNAAYDFYHGLMRMDWENTEDDYELTVKNYMIKRGFTQEVLKESKAKVSPNRNYRLVFPMFDNGKFKGWVCRTTIKRVEKVRKYLYNDGFSRATTLVGNYGSKDYVIVVEGYMDRLKFLQFGEKNVVAILGWKMSNDQIKKLKDKGITKVISALDNDECGKKGTEYLKIHFEVTRFSYLKGIKDPGEMTQSLFNKMFKKTMQDYKKKKSEEVKNGITRQDQKRVTKSRSK